MFLVGLLILFNRICFDEFYLVCHPILNQVNLIFVFRFLLSKLLIQNNLFDFKSNSFEVLMYASPNIKSILSNAGRDGARVTDQVIKKQHQRCMQQYCQYRGFVSQLQRCSQLLNSKICLCHCSLELFLYCSVYSDETSSISTAALQC